MCATALLAGCGPAVRQEDWCPRRPLDPTISGQVVLVLDGNTVCVGDSTDHRKLARIRLVDRNAPGIYDRGGVKAANALRSELQLKFVTCTQVLRDERATVARCEVVARPAM